MLIDFSITPLLLKYLWVLTSWAAAAVPGVEPVVLKVSSSIFSSPSQHVEVSSGKILNWVSPCTSMEVCVRVNVWLKVLSHRCRQEWWCCFPVWSLKSCFELEVSYLEHGELKRPDQNDRLFVVLLRPFRNSCCQGRHYRLSMYWFET